MYYATCINCSCVLLKAGEGSIIEIFCRRCNDKLYIEVKEGTVLIKKGLGSGKALLYALCINCSCELLKAGDGSMIEMFCKNCHDKLSIEVRAGTVTIMKAGKGKGVLQKSFVGNNAKKR